MESVIKLYKNFENTLKDSFIGTICTKTCQKLKSSIKESFVKKVVEKLINVDYGNNKICQLLEIFINRFAKFINRNIVKNKFLKEMIDKSLFVSILKLLVEKAWIVNGIIIALCMNIPHHMWNNIYIVGGMLLVTLLYFIRMAIFGKEKMEFRNLGIAFILFVIAVLIASFISEDKASSTRQLLFYLAAFMAYINVACTIRTKKELVEFCYLLAVMTIGMSLYGLYQNYKGVPVNSAYVDTELNQGMKGRVYGALENPNNFAEVLVLMIPLLGGIFLGERKIRNKICVLCLALMPIIVMLLTGTRSGWGALGLAAFVFCALWDKRTVPLFLIAVMLAFVALPYVSPSIYKRVKTIFVSNNDHSMGYREKIMTATLPVLRENPITGIGLGSVNFSRHIANNFDFGTSAPPHSHNVYIQMWVENGLFGLIGFLGIIFGTCIYNVKAIFKINALKKKVNTDDNEKYENMKYIKYILIATMSGTIGLALMGFLDYVLFYPRVMILFFIYQAVAKAAQKAIYIKEEE